jgi:hypothetical protein
MEPTPELIADIYTEKVRRARQTPPEEKLLVGAELYELARSFSMAGVSAENPGASEERLREAFQRRLRIARLLDERR